MRIGRQTPTRSLILPYIDTKGVEAVEIYNRSKTRTAMEWQALLLADIMAVNEDGLWTHLRFGYSLPRRNGKNEVLAIRELWGLEAGEQMLHTAHKTTTSHTAWARLCQILSEAGYTEVGRDKKGVSHPVNAYKATKQFGLETITLLRTGGSISFRTRTDSGGLGEGYDLLVIDEAQEYTIEQESTLIYTVSASDNPQTILCGTPPTMVSAGTVFTDMRDEVLSGETQDCGWAEWGVDEEPAELDDIDLWYETNPSMGLKLKERVVRQEMRKDKLDFVIQRLGYWFRYSLKSVISTQEWADCKVDKLPDLAGPLSVGVKFGRDGLNVSMSIACRTWDNKIFVEAIDCRPINAGNAWILSFLRAADYSAVVLDGNGAKELAEEMKDVGLKRPMYANTAEFISANAMFVQALADKQICHAGQPSLAQSVTNVEKRTIGTQGGYGFRSLKDGVDVTLLDSVILALYQCTRVKAKRKQKISY